MTTTPPGSAGLTPPGGGEIDRLLAEFLDGTLAGPDLDRLFEVLRGNPRQLEELVDLLQIDGQLLNPPLSDAHGEARILVRQVEARLSGSTRMVQAVLARAEGKSSPGTVPARRTGTRLETARSARRPLLQHLGVAAAGLGILAAGYFAWDGLRPARTGSASDPARFPADPSFASITHASDGTIRRAAGRESTAKPGDPVPAGAILETPAAGRAGVRFTDASAVDLHGGTRAVFGSAGRGLRVDLETGRVTVRMSPAAGRAPFVIATPCALATAFGTEFDVAVSKEGAQVTVKSGRVRVAPVARPPDAAVFDAGQQVVVAPDGAMTVGAAGASRRILADFEAPATGGWLQKASPGASLRLSRAAPGRRGGGALLAEFDVPEGGWAWFARDTALGPYDWREFRAVGFWCRGSASGGRIFFELFDNRGSPAAGDTYERFVCAFVDDTAEWRFIRMPFDRFVRRDWQPDGAPNDGLGLDAVGGFGFVFTGKRGAIVVDDIQLLAD
jgi:ferric-dicitrate binding protein FerR (iron transport regulator)